MTLIITALAFIIGSIAVARATRLAVHDAYPPTAWLRHRWLEVTEPHERRASWAPLLSCPFCFAPYAAAVNLTWAYLAGVHTGSGEPWAAAWWLVNLWAAGSYVAAMVVLRDEPPEE